MKPSLVSDFGRQLSKQFSRKQFLDEFKARREEDTDDITRLIMDDRAQIMLEDYINNFLKRKS